MIDRKTMSRMLLSVSSKWKEKSNYLSEIDAKFGDGDHGFTMTKIAAVIDNSITDEKPIKEVLSIISKGASGVGGGSAGPLWGAFFEGLSKGIENDTIDARTLKNMFKNALEELKTISNAKVGDKTMMDALIPAVSESEKSDDNIKDILLNAAKASESGVKATESFQAKFGRAKFSKEKTIGTPDPGAISMSIFFRAFSDNY